MNNEIILCSLPDSNAIKQLTVLQIGKFDEYDKSLKVKIVQKLYPNEMGYISHPSSEIVYKREKCKKAVTYYLEAHSNIPSDESVYGTLPDVKPILIYNPKNRKVRK